MNTKLFNLMLGILIATVLGACTGGSDDDETETTSVVELAEADGNFTTLLAALEATDLDEILGDDSGTFTVFAPTDTAFDALGQAAIDELLANPDDLSDILLYHVIQGAEVDAATAISLAGSTQEMANGDDLALSLCGMALCVNLSEVITEDLQADNGIVHVIDRVLIPPAEPGMPMSNIVETAINAGSFTTLVSALQAADLVDTLASTDDPSARFTVFAPTDAAFDLIPDAVLDGLLEDIPSLTQVLLQHVISGSVVDSVTAFSLNGTSVNTAANEDVTIEIVDGSLQIQGSTVSTFDIYASNGVIHVIDAVITETLPQ